MEATPAFACAEARPWRLPGLFGMRSRAACGMSNGESEQKDRRVEDREHNENCHGGHRPGVLHHPPSPRTLRVLSIRNTSGALRAAI